MQVMAFMRRLRARVHAPATLPRPHIRCRVLSAEQNMKFLCGNTRQRRRALCFRGTRDAIRRSDVDQITALMRRMLRNPSGSDDSNAAAKHRADKRSVTEIKRASPDGCLLPRRVRCGPVVTGGSVDGRTVSHPVVSLAKMILTLLLLLKVRPV